MRRGSWRRGGGVAESAAMNLAWPWWVDAGLALGCAALLLRVHPLERLWARSWEVLMEFPKLWRLLALAGLAGWLRDGAVGIQTGGWAGLNQLPRVAEVWQGAGWRAVEQAGRLAGFFFTPEPLSGLAAVWLLTGWRGVGRHFRQGCGLVFGKGGGLAWWSVAVLAVAEAAWLAGRWSGWKPAWLEAPAVVFQGMVVVAVGAWFQSVVYLALRAPAKAGDAEAVLAVALRRMPRLWPLVLVWLAGRGLALWPGASGPAVALAGLAAAAGLGFFAPVRLFGAEGATFWASLRRSLALAGRCALGVCWFFPPALVTLMLFYLPDAVFSPALPASTLAGALWRGVHHLLEGCLTAWLAAGWVALYEERSRA